MTSRTSFIISTQAKALALSVDSLHCTLGSEKEIHGEVLPEVEAVLRDHCSRDQLLKVRDLFERAAS